MSEKYIIAHDLGTSENKAVLVSIYGEIIHTERKSYPILYPGPGLAEQAPFDWWDAVCQTTRSVIEKSGVHPKNIVGVTFSSQVQNLVSVDKKGNPLMPAISWMDGRSAAVMQEKLWKPPRILGYNIFNLVRFLRITGGTPGHSGKDIVGKILWLQRFQPEIFKKIHKFLDAKDFIIYHLTGNFVKSIDMGVVWWLMDNRKKRNSWHPGLCRLAGISTDMLPDLKESAAIVGNVTLAAAEKTGLPPGIPVINGAGDISATALGSGALAEGELHICIGTAGWVAGHFTRRKIDLAHYAGCIGSTYPQEYYLAMAHQISAGACLEWFKNKILFPQDQDGGKNNPGNIYSYLDQLAAAAEPGAAGLLFTPWMYGEHCPLDDEHVRAGFFNIGLNHSRKHLVRAVLEGVSFNARWAMEILENLYTRVERLNIIGGGAKSDTWCQITADITNRIINQVENPHYANAKGVALLASMALGYIESFHDIKKYIKIKQSFYPQTGNRAIYDMMFDEFKNLYKQNKSWYKRMNPRPAEVS